MAKQSNDIIEQLESWYQTPAGSFLYEQEQRITWQLLEPLWGHRLLQLGGSGDQVLAQHRLNLQRIHAAPVPSVAGDVCSELDCVPFPSESIDILIVFHAIEFAGNPHQLLREADRVLAPRGELIMLGFNPWSLFGLLTLLSRYSRRRLWGRVRPLSKHRLRDWLRLLGMSVKSVQHSFCVPPWGEGRLQRALHRAAGYATRKNWPFGGVYILHARKNVTALTPDRVRWNQRVGDRLIGLATPQPVPSPRAGNAGKCVKSVEAFTDGACRGNPGPGGWGVLLRYQERERSLHGGAAETTNNRMELTAAIEALKALKQPCKVTLTTDSEYLRKGITEWIHRWMAKGWKTSAKKPVKNVDLWQALEQERARHQVDWRWVKGHSGHRENELADQLANRGIDEL